MFGVGARRQRCVYLVASGRRVPEARDPRAETLDSVQRRRQPGSAAETTQSAPPLCTNRRKPGIRVRSPSKGRRCQTESKSTFRMSHTSTTSPSWKASSHLRQSTSFDVHKDRALFGSAAVIDRSLAEFRCPDGLTKIYVCVV
ncbi:hypothetical protein MRX96_021414 [Rhipicephalus microplus]